MRVLVVDDHENVVSGVEMKFAKLDSTIVAVPCSGCKDTLEELQTEKIDAAIVDLGLQDGNGFMVLDETKKFKVPVVILS